MKLGRIQLEYLWWEADWLESLSYTEKAVWPTLLTYVANMGDPVAGECKAVSSATIARITGAPKRAVDGLLDAALIAGQIVVSEAGIWIVPDWKRYMHPSEKEAALARARRKTPATCRRRVADVSPTGSLHDGDNGGAGPDKRFRVGPPSEDAGDPNGLKARLGLT